MAPATLDGPALSGPPPHGNTRATGVCWSMILADHHAPRGALGRAPRQLRARRAVPPDTAWRTWWWRAVHGFRHSSSS
ncbi:hypothetical protein QJS66_09930 [Kocuria rhizophila]|nr:hypothetical protein QJS66_09930 [Kocuria rhizophila]